MQESVGVVAIGRNEGQRLAACLASARRDCAVVVYVDSGSKDGSVELARSMGAHVVELDLTRPFTAARARNEGFAKLREVSPSVELVQFLDGDCEMAAGWIHLARAGFLEKPKAAVVCGRRRERFPQASIYNRLCDMEWNTPIGTAKACGGDALIRVAAFTAVGGYDGSVIAGEEPEMCVRLRSQGWTIERIDAEMTLHDAAMTRFGQWWTRNVRAGHAYAQGNAMHGKPPERFREREVRSIEFWAVAPLITAMILTVAAAVWSPRFWWIGVVAVLVYPALVMKITLRRMKSGQRISDALLYGSSVVIGKFPQYQGVRKYRSSRRHGGISEIIEYKRPETPAARQL